MSGSADYDEYGNITEAGRKNQEAEAALASGDAAKAAKAAADKNTTLGNSLYGPGGAFQLSGSPEQQAGAQSGLQFGQMLYGQGIGDVGKESAEYGQMVKGRLNADSAQADVYRQGANRRLAQGANKLGMAGASLGGAQEQNYRQSGMQASAMNQDYKDKALALYGRNISAKQQGLAGQYMAGAGIGQASTPGAVANYSSGCAMCIIATNMFLNRELDKNNLLSIFDAGRNLDKSTYTGYIILANPLVSIRNGFFIKKLMIPAFLSYANKKPNITAKIVMAVSFVVGTIFLKLGSNYHFKIMSKYTKNDLKMRKEISC